MNDQNERLKTLEDELDVIKDKVVQAYKDKKSSSPMRISLMKAAKSVSLIAEAQEEEMGEGNVEKKQAKLVIKPTYIEQSRVVSEYKEEKFRENKKIKGIRAFGKGKRDVIYKVGLVLMMIFLIVLAIYFVLSNENSKVESWDDCIKQEGSVIQISYPRVCVTKKGEKFTESIETENEEVPGDLENKNSEPEDNESNEDEEKKEEEIIRGKGCVVGGCNSELCLEEGKENEIYSICLYKPEYTCLKHAICEKQQSEDCGWTVTEEYNVCNQQFLQ